MPRTKLAANGHRRFGWAALGGLVWSRSQCHEDPSRWVNLGQKERWAILERAHRTGSNKPHATKCKKNFPCRSAYGKDGYRSRGQLARLGLNVAVCYPKGWHHGRICCHKGSAKRRRTSKSVNRTRHANTAQLAVPWLGLRSLSIPRAASCRCRQPSTLDLQYRCQWRIWTGVAVPEPVVGNQLLPASEPCSLAAGQGERGCDPLFPCS